VCVQLDALLIRGGEKLLELGAIPFKFVAAR
jgi:hypothetical protein